MHSLDRYPWPWWTEWKSYLRLQRWLFFWISNRRTSGGVYSLDWKIDDEFHNRKVKHHPNFKNKIHAKNKRQPFVIFCYPSASALNMGLLNLQMVSPPQEIEGFMPPESSLPPGFFHIIFRQPGIPKQRTANPTLDFSLIREGRWYWSGLPWWMGKSSTCSQASGCPCCAAADKGVRPEVSAFSASQRDFNLKR